MSLWVRDYTDSDSHPQMLKAGHHGRQIFRFLCRLSGRYDLAGKIPNEYLEPEYLVAHAGLRCCQGCPVATTSHAAEGVTKLLDVGLLVRNGDFVTEIDGWTRRQPKAPLSNAERQQAFRARRNADRNAKVTGVTALEKRREEKSIEDQRLPSFGNDGSGGRVDWFVGAWNRLAIPEYPRVQTISAERRRKATKSLKNVTNPQVEAAIANLNLWTYRGRDGTWKPSFDYLLQDDNLVKFSEGSKGGKATPSVRNGPVRAEDMDWSNQPLGKVDLK